MAEEVVPLDRLRVQKIDIEIMNEELQGKDTALRSRMKTKEGEFFSQNDFDEDLKALAQEFDRVDPVLKESNGKLTIGIKLWPKPIIRAIIWQGNEKVKTDKLEKQLGFKSKMVFDRSSFNKAFHKLKVFYIKRGYFESDLEYKVSRDPNANLVDIIIQIKEGRAGRIKKIIFNNFTKKEQEDLEEVIFTKPYSVLTSWFTQEGTNQPEMLHYDELTILNYLHNEGYADAHVETKVEEANEKNRIVITFTADKGQVYHVGQIQWHGNTLFSTEELQKRSGLKESDIYSPEELRRAVQSIGNLYGSKGYVDASCTPQTKLIKGKQIYNIDFQVEEGDRFRVGIIKIFGNNRTQNSVILHETLLVPGEIFDSSLLSKTEERLRNIGYFKNVHVYAVKSSRGESSAVHFRDIHIEVEENPTTGRYSAFIGYSTDKKNLFGGLTITELNFNLKGIGSIFSKGLGALRGGGEYLGFTWTIGTKQLKYNLAWSKANFLDTPWILGVEFEKSRDSFSSKDYTIRSYSAQVNGSYPVNAFVKAGTQYRLTHSFIRLKGIRHTHRNRELIRESKNGGLISAIGPFISYDSRNKPMNPTQGVYSKLIAEYAGLGGDHKFINLGYFNTYYWSPYSKGVFKFRGNINFIKTLGSTKAKDLPLDERFYTGGEQTIRGYLYNRVGPKFRDKDHTSRGGLSNILLTADYEQYIFKKLDAFVFFDAGNVYFKQFYLGKLRYSAGYGIKVKVIENVPLVFGVGYPLNPENKKDVKRFFFSIGSNY